jgi:hypothetical protein
MVPTQIKTSFIPNYFKIGTIKARYDALFSNCMHKALKFNKQIESQKEESVTQMFARRH